jgi:lipid-binding SYLF domain-containing protein
MLFNLHLPPRQTCRLHRLSTPGSSASIDAKGIGGAEHGGMPPVERVRAWHRARRWNRRPPRSGAMPAIHHHRPHMKPSISTLCRAAILLPAAMICSQCAYEPVTQANAAQVSGADLSRDARAALDDLYEREPAARRLGRSATAVLVFPHIRKGGLMVGAEAGNGVLFGRNGRVEGYYQSAGASYGLQAGVQEYGYALFLMNSAELSQLNRAAGWEIGSSPDVVMVDRGMSATLTTRTADRGTFAFVFNQRGLMAGLSFKGTKITRIQPGR